MPRYGNGSPPPPPGSHATARERAAATPPRDRRCFRDRTSRIIRAMSDPKHKGGARDRTMAVDVGGDRPAPGAANLYGKRQPIPKGLTYRLRIEAGPKAPGVIPIRESLLVLGRGAGIADIDVGDESASRRHACIEYADGGFWLSDMGSTNGTILNGELVQRARLADGDEIQIGTAVMRFERG